jgi:hypothetical protein
MPLGGEITPHDYHPQSIFSPFSYLTPVYPQSIPWFLQFIHCPLFKPPVPHYFSALFNINNHPEPSGINQKP